MHEQPIESHVIQCLLLLNTEIIFRAMGAAALQKYIGGLGGIGTSGVGSSSSFAPKELNEEVMPDKVNTELFCSVYMLCFAMFPQLHETLLFVFLVRGNKVEVE